jgi:hypothetical protein
VEGEGEWFVVHQNGEVPGLQHVTEVLHGFINHQEFSVIGTVLLLGQAQLPGEKGEGLPDFLHSLLEDGTNGGGRSVRDQGERSGWIWMSQESSLRQACLSLIEGCNECVGPGDRVGAFDFGARKDLVERGLVGGCMREETPIEIQHFQETS